MPDFIHKKRNRKNLVLFVHGITGDEDTWKSGEITLPQVILEDKAIASNFDMAYFSYYSKLLEFPKAKMIAALIQNAMGKTVVVPTNTGVIELGNLLDSHINVHYEKYENIVVVAHSMGGLVAKACMLKRIREQGTTGNIKFFLSLAVPHKGSNWANVGKLLFKKHKQVVDLSPVSESLDRINEEWISAAELVPRTIYFYGEWDQVVTPRSAMGHGIGNRATVACDDDHFSICKPDRRDKLSTEAIRRYLLEFIRGVEISDSLLIQKFQDRGQLDQELFVVKLLVADVHNVCVRTAKETFFNAEFMTRRLLARGFNKKRIEDLYEKIKLLYTELFMDLVNGKLKDSNELVTEIHKSIRQENDKLLTVISLELMNSYHKIGMLHQLANKMEEDIWWAVEHSQTNFDSLRKARGI